LYTSINNYIISKKNISICKKKEDEIKELNKFKKIVKRRQWKIHDILPTNIHYIFIYSNITLLKYLHYNKVNLFVSNEDFVKNLEVMEMSKHYEMMHIYTNWYYNTLSENDKNEVSELIVRTSSNYIKYNFFKKMYNLIDFLNYLKKEDNLYIFFNSLNRLDYHTNYNLFISLLLKVPNGIKIFLTTKPNLNKLSENNLNLIKNCEPSILVELYCIFNLIDEKDLFTREILFNKISKNREDFFSKITQNFKKEVL